MISIENVPQNAKAKKHKGIKAVENVAAAAAAIK